MTQHRDTCQIHFTEVPGLCTCDFDQRRKQELAAREADPQSQYAADRERAYECDHGGRS